MTASLLIHNVGYIFNSLLILGLIAFVIRSNYRTKINILLILSLLATATFTVSHVIGVNLSDPELSRSVLMFNVCILFISAFLAHFIFVFIGKEKEQRIPIILIYTISFILMCVYLIYPETFLQTSVPKLYFPNYYVAGSLDWVMRIFSNIIVPTYFLIHMILAYRHGDAIMQNRLKYLFGALSVAYFFGAIPLPLIFTEHPTLFGLVIDPVYSLPFAPIFAITFTYAVLKYELLDIKVVAKQAFVYAIATAFVGIFIVLFGASSEILRSQFPFIPSWLLPFVSSVIAVSIGAIVWNKLRESDALKYEFITVVTHKFRGPLTQIKWLSESLGSTIPKESRGELDQIQNANFRLIEMTNLLVRLSDTDNAEYSYHFKLTRIGKLLNELIPEYRNQASLKKMTLIYNDDSVQMKMIDATKMKFVLQILLDNAINYTPVGGSISITTHDETSGDVLLTVKDSGMGLNKEDAGRLFQKFWRSTDALHADVNGMGIGLFMARNIIDRHGGKLWASSDGSGKGSTFSVLLKK